MAGEDLTSPREAGDSARSSLGAQVHSGITWSTLSTLTIRLGTFAVGILAARLLAPEQFGVFAVALTVHMIVLNMCDLGVSAYVVRTREALPEVAPTVVSLAMGSAASLAVLMALSASWLATALGSPGATGAIRVLALTIALAGVSAVPSALLQREFLQQRRFVAEALGFVASSAVLVGLALEGAGVLALAWSRVAGHVLVTVSVVLLAPCRYRPGFSRAAVGRVLSFGVPLVGASFLGFLIGNIDYIVISRLLGAHDLGLYYLAYNVASWPYVILSPIVASVLMAAFSRVRDDRERLPQYVGSALAAVTAVAMPASALLAALAVPLVAAVYGEKWSGAATALAVAAVYGACRIPVDILSNLLVALGRTRAMFVGQLLYGAVLVPLVLVGVARFGIVGAGLAHVVGISAVLLPTYLWVVWRSSHVSAAHLLRAAAPPVLTSVLAGAAAYLAVRDWSGGWWPLLTGSVVGAAVYLGCLGRWLLRLRASLRALWASPVLDADVPAPVRMAVASQQAPA